MAAAAVDTAATAAQQLAQAKRNLSATKRLKKGAAAAQTFWLHEIASILDFGLILTICHALLRAVPPCTRRVMCSTECPPSAGAHRMPVICDPM